MDGILLDVLVLRREPSEESGHQVGGKYEEVCCGRLNFKRNFSKKQRVVRKGGWIAYSTCSLEPEETKLPLQLSEELGLQTISWGVLPEGIQEAQKGFWQLLPSRHWMGFSAVILKKS